MGEIDRVRPTLSFAQLRNAGQHQVGERKRRPQGEHQEQQDEPQDTIELGDQQTPVPEPTPAGDGGEDGEHIDVAA